MIYVGCYICLAVGFLVGYKWKDFGDPKSEQSPDPVDMSAGVYVKVNEPGPYQAAVETPIKFHGHAKEDINTGDQVTIEINGRGHPYVTRRRW